MKKLLFFAAVAVITAVSCNDNNECQPPRTMTLDFESVPSTYFAGPTAYGQNLYSSYTPSFSGYDPAFPLYTGYHDAKTDLQMGLNKDEGEAWSTGAYEFYAGGIAISRWSEDQTTNSFENQCTVFSATGSTDKGGRGGSRTFAVVSVAQPTSIGFKNAATEREFESMWVTNTTYTTLTIKNGGGPASPLEAANGWLLLTIEGFRANGASAGVVAFYLADFRTAGSAGLVEEWTKVSLLSLGKVNRLEFSITGSDTGAWGLNTPSYFCFDDLTFRL
ncbi:MAG: DUF4465 domain-containing protein [Rikenellaceae bacterium]|nr:DUF4465 domain-containing protein [Rikenellaceae bacterium]MCL2693266.1 DUF4465 domain-containing protein [Rikenellaceae bacterium]